MYPPEVMSDNSDRELGDVYSDLREFKEVKETVNELLRIKKLLRAYDKENVEKFNEMRSKALMAINNLFDVCAANPKK